MIHSTLVPSILMLTLMTPPALGSSLRTVTAQERACGSEIQAIEINNATLRYFECGKGEPLVFVHGGFGGLHTFGPQAQTFASRFRVIAYSRRYFPPNAPPRATDVNSLSVHVADLRALVTELKATPAHLVGSSYGAYIALALAMNHPELVRSLVLGEPPVLTVLARTSVGEGVRQWWIRRVMEPSRKAFESGNPEEGFRQLLNGICGPGCFDNRPESERTALVEKHGPELRSFMMTDASMLTPPLECGDLSKLKHPTLLVTGERSPAFFLLITAELERCLEGEAQVMVPEAGHGMHRDNASFLQRGCGGLFAASLATTRDASIRSSRGEHDELRVVGPREAAATTGANRDPRENCSARSARASTRCPWRNGRRSASARS